MVQLWNVQPDTGQLDEDQRSNEILQVSQALKTTVGGINGGQMQSCQRYLYLTILSQGRTIDVGVRNAVP